MNSKIQTEDSNDYPFKFNKTGKFMRGKIQLYRIFIFQSKPEFRNASIKCRKS